MDLSGKRVSGEGCSSNGGSNLQLVPHSENKKVCPFCKREFKCGKSLGGHIRVHRKSHRTTKFTHKKSNRRGFGSSSALTRPTVVNGVRGGDIAAPLRIVENGGSCAAVTTLRTPENGAEAPLRTAENGACGAEIHDMSTSLVGCGWQTKRRRGSNEETNHMMIVNHSYSDDEYEECDVEDSCDEDDYENIKLRKWLRSRGYPTGAHKICWTRRMLMCKVCNQFFRTLSAVITHVDECALTNSEIEMDTEMERVRNEENGRVEVDQVVGEQQNGNGEGKVGKMPEDAALTKDNAGSSGVGEKQPASTSSATSKRLHLDLNEMPPHQKD